ncbi:PLP-dependent aminotransferase family protein [Lentzea jiangxiensis]|uniref:GntR family transcriptional regulator / MocR family aminotransferase n=1 Tax=Lentzea jiangxiensis TaxID=641025 RepID=A0A1H0T8I8_9PSEU|nr:PLP-dependent aminotransferase family protein [Lentzea jiangxiensis]SDP50121.1 GntR family transcriptional regulator / MocR family aminotransferase [Lentzea jiangxiensis]
MTANWTTLRELLLPGHQRRRGVEVELRRAIRDGRLAPGTRLPSSRDLAAQLEVARGTVTSAYTQLVAEGYLTTRRGSGTTVASLGPAGACGVPEPPKRWRYNLRPGLPALGAFPRAEWVAAHRAALADLPDDDLAYPDPAGFVGLRKEIVDYLARVRAVVTKDAVITNGAADGLQLTARMLDGSIAIEEPSHIGGEDLLRSHSVKTVPIPVDDKGLRVDLLSKTDCRAVLVTAAHQFPLGVVLHPERRRALVEWARERDALIIEDDYDAEHRYDRPALSALQALAPEHVVYQGTTSKVLAPALRLGWLVVPERLREDIVNRKRYNDMGTATIPQAAFAHLLRTGGYDRHLRRTRALYRKRRDALLEAVAEHLPAWQPIGVAAGLHVVLRMPDGTDDLALKSRLEERGVHVWALAQYTRTPMWPGLVLGYASLTPDRLREAVREIAAVAEA